MFDVTQLTMTRQDQDGVPTFTIAPADLYPPVIARIREALASYRAIEAERGSAPWASEVVPELVAPPHRGGDARAVVLLNNALQLPDQAWDDALVDRDRFYPEIPYGISLEALRAIGATEDMMVTPRRVKARGDALEVVMGWFAHALRIAVGGNSTTITRDLRFRL